MAGIVAGIGNGGGVNAQKFIGSVSVIAVPQWGVPICVQPAIQGENAKRWIKTRYRYKRSCKFSPSVHGKGRFPEEVVSDGSRETKERLGGFREDESPPSTSDRGGRSWRVCKWERNLFWLKRSQ